MPGFMTNMLHRFGLPWNQLRFDARDSLLVACTVFLIMALAGVVLAAIASGLAIGGILMQGQVFAHGLFDPAWRLVLSLVLAIIGLSAVAHATVRVLEIIGTIAMRQPFAAANAGRIEAIAVRVLELWLLGWIARWLEMPIGGSFNGFELSVGTGNNNLAFALVLFVLARVFRHGNRLETEVEGTV